MNKKLSSNYTYDVFISYSRLDIKIVKPLVKEFQSLGLKVWFDIEGVECGEEFDEKIIKAIDKSDSLVFMYSNNAEKAEWTKKEVLYAKSQGKKIIPVILQHNMPKQGWFIFHFGDINCIDIQDPVQKDQLIYDFKKTFCLIGTGTEDTNEKNQNRTLSRKGILAFIVCALVLMCLYGLYYIRPKNILHIPIMWSFLLYRERLSKGSRGRKRLWQGIVFVDKEGRSLIIQRDIVGRANPHRKIILLGNIGLVGVLKMVKVYL